MGSKADHRGRLQAALPGLIDDLRRFVAIPSISGEGAPPEPLFEAHDFVVERLRAIGVEDIEELVIEGKVAPVVVVALRSPGETLWAAEASAGKIDAPWAIAAVEPRGTGDTAWGPELQWHVRRAAAWTGRTIASMQVWDTLRALEAVRRLPGLENAKTALSIAYSVAAFFLSQMAIRNERNAAAPSPLQNVSTIAAPYIAARDPSNVATRA